MQTYIYTHRCLVYLAIITKEIEAIILRVCRYMKVLRDNIYCVTGERDGYGPILIYNIKVC